MSLDISNSQNEFDLAVSKINSLKKRPSDKELLEIYGLYKRVKDGNCYTQRPGGFDLKAKAKWDSWNSMKKYSKQKAEEMYVKLADEFSKKYN